jgi:hypothetical protein
VKVDVFNHVMPARYLELMKSHSRDAGLVKRMSSLRMLWDIDARVAMLAEKFPDVQQVLTLSLPPPEALGYFAGRAETLWAQLGSRSADEDYSAVLKNLAKPPLEYFRMFYGDTVLGGASAPLACGLAFFGADRVVFASDCPFDPEGGPMFIREGDPLDRGPRARPGRQAQDLLRQRDAPPEVQAARRGLKVR